MSDEVKIIVGVMGVLVLLVCATAYVELRKAEIYASALGNIDVSAAVKLIESIGGE